MVSIIRETAPRQRHTGNSYGIYNCIILRSVECTLSNAYHLNAAIWDRNSYSQDRRDDGSRAPASRRSARTGAESSGAGP